MHDTNGSVPGWVLSLDPGETTGWALFHQGQLYDSGQISTVKQKHCYWPELIDLLRNHVNRGQRGESIHVVYEDYRVYNHKLERHSYSTVPTLRIIGGIEMYCYMNGMAYSSNMAVTVKPFVTDDKLKVWNMYQKGKKHARDAIRHGVYYILINCRGDKK